MCSKKPTLLYRLQRKLFTFLGDIKVFGWKHPLWFEVNAHGYRLKGEHYRTIHKLIQPGDILIRRFDGYLSSYMIPGFWNHAGIYIGDDGNKPEQVIHAVSEGVIQEDLLNFMRADHMAVLRPQKRNYQEAVDKAKSIVGKPYDFGFDFQDANRFSCTELVAHCYPGLVEGSKKFGKQVIIADDFYGCNDMITVWNSQNEMTTMGVVQTFLIRKCPFKEI